MTENEVIDILDDLRTFGHEPDEHAAEALSTAIDFIQKLQEYFSYGSIEMFRCSLDVLQKYKEIGTVSECKQAMEFYKKSRKENTDEDSLCTGTREDCVLCHDKYQMPHWACCLQECGEHEFCRGCDKGIYLKGE